MNEIQLSFRKHFLSLLPGPASRTLGCLVLAVMFLLLQTDYPCFAQNAVQNNPTSKTSLLAQAQAGEPVSGYRPPSSSSIVKQGIQLIDSGRIQEALLFFQNYGYARPQDASAYFWMGVCYDELGNYPAAIQAYRDALSKAEQSSMDSSEIRVNLGNSLLKQNELEQAIESYKKALEINPLYGLAQLNLGRAYIARKDFQEALASFDKCDEMHFSARQLPYYRAKALMGLGRKDEAAVAIQRLLQDLPAGQSKSAIQQEFQSCLPAQ